MFESEDFINALAKRVKPDLNHIYTEQPFQTDGGLDFGWFCREHALHLFLLAAVLGLKGNKILLGDIIVKKGLQFISTLNTDAEHAWCAVADTVPVDASISLRYFDNMPDLNLIYGCNASYSAPYSVYYLDGSEPSRIDELLRKEEPIIVFLPKEIVTVNPGQLINDPYSFLHDPPEDCPKYTEIHGEDIFNMITMHCYKLIMGKAKPLCKHYSVDESRRRIKKWNPNAREEMYKLLSL